MDRYSEDFITDLKELFEYYKGDRARDNIFVSLVYSFHIKEEYREELKRKHTPVKAGKNFLDSPELRNAYPAMPPKSIKAILDERNNKGVE